MAVMLYYAGHGYRGWMCVMRKTFTDLDRSVVFGDIVAMM